MKGTIDFRGFMEEFINLLFEQLKNPIDIKDTIYQEYLVLIPKGEEKLTEFYQRFFIKGKKMIIPNKKARSLNTYFNITDLPGIRKYALRRAFVINPEEEHMDYLVNVNEAYFLVGIREKEFERIARKYSKLQTLP